MFSMLGKEGIICVPSNVSSFARAFDQQIHVILYACVPMILDSNGPTVYNNTIQVHEPQAETDSLKLFWFWPNVCSQYIDNIHN